jgi:hypothetical protein
MRLFLSLFLFNFIYFLWLAHEAIIEAMVDKFNFALAQIQGIREAEVRTSPVITGVFPLILFSLSPGGGDCVVSSSKNVLTRVTVYELPAQHGP